MQLRSGPVARAARYLASSRSRPAIALRLVAVLGIFAWIVFDERLHGPRMSGLGSIAIAAGWLMLLRPATVRFPDVLMPGGLRVASLAVGVKGATQVASGTHAPELLFIPVIIGLLMAVGGFWRFRRRAGKERANAWVRESLSEELRILAPPIGERRRSAPSAAP